MNREYKEYLEFREREQQERIKSDPSLRERVQKGFFQAPEVGKRRCEDECEGLLLDPDCYLLAGDSQFHTQSAIGKFMLPAAGAFISIFAVMMGRATTKRPLFSGIQSYFVSGAVGWAIGTLGMNYKDKVAAERDLQFFHYVRLHPEDFQPPKRILYRDYLKPWQPIR